jgi:hypothetical protein
MSLAAVSGNFRVQKKNWARNFECDRAGKPKFTQHLVESDRTRPMRGSKRSGCPMRLKMSAVSKDNVDGPWQIEHTSLNSEVHNHSPSDDVRVHTAHRRRAAASTVACTAVMASFIDGQTAVGVSVAKIRAAILHRDPNSLVLHKDIGNFKMKTRNQTIATHTPIEALFSLLRQHNFYFRFDVFPGTTQLWYLFWAHPATIRLYKLHCDVLIADGTFKTNKYDLPLVNIISMTGMNNVVPVAQCFLSGQNEDDFLWFLQALRAMMENNQIDLPCVILSDRELAILNFLWRVFPTVPSVIGGT